MARIRTPTPHTNARTPTHTHTHTPTARTPLADRPMFLQIVPFALGMGLHVVIATNNRKTTHIEEALPLAMPHTDTDQVLPVAPSYTHPSRLALPY